MFLVSWALVAHRRQLSELRMYYYSLLINLILLVTLASSLVARLLN